MTAMPCNTSIRPSITLTGTRALRGGKCGRELSTSETPLGVSVARAIGLTKSQKARRHFRARTVERDVFLCLVREQRIKQWSDKSTPKRRLRRENSSSLLLFLPPSADSPRLGWWVPGLVNFVPAVATTSAWPCLQHSRNLGTSF